MTKLGALVFCVLQISIKVISTSFIENKITCKDNEGNYVDWWHIYKLPNGVGAGETGDRFAYITSNTRRWQMTEQLITDDTLLQYSLSPIYKHEHTHTLALLVYEESHTSSANGVLMADEGGGLWITHTMNNFLHLSAEKPIFQKEELENGHLIMCMSLNITTLNNLATLLRHVTPVFTDLIVPKNLQSVLPEWQFVNKSIFVDRTVDFGFEINDGTKVLVLTKAPGDNRFVYRSFARMMKIVLDVYSPKPNLYTLGDCGPIYGVRQIPSISLTFPNGIYYIKNSIDLSRFAVSTAAHWQTKGSGRTQYWACTSNLDINDESQTGGMLICLENYNVWVSFDNLKVKEPDC